MDDVLVLIRNTYTTDAEGNQIPAETRRTVFCQVSSVGRSEFYQAAQADMHPEYIFTLSNFRDYQGEKLAKYTDWLGTEHLLYITRAYRIPDEDAIELTCEERTGSLDYEDESESGDSESGDWESES